MEGADLSIVDKNNKKPSQLLTKQNDEINKLLLNPPIPSYPCLEIYKSTNSLLLNSSIITENVIELPNENLEFQSEESSNKENDDETSNINQELLVFWPPIQRQIRLNQTSCRLNNSNNVSICMKGFNTDLLSIPIYTGLIETLEQLNMTVDVNSDFSLGSKIKIIINQTICPGRHKFEINVETEEIEIIASDKTGLYYAIYTFNQLLQLHTDIEMDKGITTIIIPSIRLIDWPDIQNRAILWTYTKLAKTNMAIMKDKIKFFSKIRINIIYLVIDPFIKLNYNNKPHQLIEESNSSLDDELFTDVCSTNDSMEEIDNSTSEIFLLDKFSQLHCIELVPYIILTSMHHILPIEMLKNNSSPMINIVFSFEEDFFLEELMKQYNENNYYNQIFDKLTINKEIELICYNSCLNAMLSMQMIGITTISMSSTKWVKKIVNPIKMAAKLGFVCIEKDYNEIYSSPLVIKPIISTIDLMIKLKDYSLKINENGSSIAILPGFIDSNFMYPTILLKYYCFLFSAFMWNRNSTIDMIGDINSDFSIIKEVVTLIIFTNQTSNYDSYKSILCLFTGEILTSIDNNTSTVINTNKDKKEIKPNMIKIEKILWSLLLCNETNVANISIPNKNEVVYCLRFYRRLLNIANWKLGSVNNEHKYSEIMETDELFSIINLLSILCRAIVLAYTTIEKNTNGDNKNEEVKRTFIDLLKILPLGTKSDIANSLLESMKYNLKIWEKKFRNFDVISNKNLHQNISGKYYPYVSNTTSSSTTFSKDLMNQEIIIPGSVFFKIISSLLPN